MPHILRVQITAIHKSLLQPLVNEDSFLVKALERVQSLAGVGMHMVDYGLVLAPVGN